MHYANKIELNVKNKGEWVNIDSDYIVHHIS